MKSRTNLPSFPLFASLPPREAQRLFASLPRRSFHPGQTLLEEGDDHDHVYFLLQGEAEIIKNLGTSDERLLAIRGPGTIIGEMSLFSERSRHTATVRARTALQTLETSRAELDKLLRREPALSYALLRTLSRRLEESENLTITDLRQKNEMLRRAYKELAAAQDALVEKEKLEHELVIARDIQRALLPRELPQIGGYDLGASMEPMRAVGGDFYDFIPLPDGSLGLAIGDVSGHGVPAALYMAITVTLLRSAARRLRSPRAALGMVNDQLLALGPTGAFVTVLYGRLEPATGAFTYCRAGHEDPLLLDGNGEPATPPRRPSQLLGFFQHPQLRQRRLVIPENGAMLLFTDGIPEVTSPEGEMFGRGRLMRATRAARALPAQEICHTLLSRARRHRAQAPLQDDMTLLAVKRI